MHIIGVAGRAGAGKHVVAAAIAAVLDENGYSVKLDSFGRDIKRAVRDESSGLVDKVRDRRTMQVLGAEMRRRNPKCLVDDLAVRNNLSDRAGCNPRFEPADVLIIADIRDEAELRFCKDRGGIILFIEGSFAQLKGTEAVHPSEYLAETICALDVDFTLNKQSSPARLAAAAAELVRGNLAAFLKEKEAGNA